MRESNMLLIEVTVREVRFLRWEKGFWRQQPKISCESIPFNENVSKADNRINFGELSEIIRAYKGRCLDKKTASVYLLIPFHNGLIREFKLPWLKKSDRDSAVKYYLQYEIPGLADELLYDYLVSAEKQTEYLNITVTAARQDMITAYADCFKQAGYRLMGIEYSVTAFGAILKSQTEKRVLILHTVKDNLIQFVLYKDAVPELIREINVGIDDINKYQIYLGLKDYETPLDGIITDGSVPAERIAQVLIDDGLVQGRVVLPQLPLRQAMDSDCGAVDTTAILGKVYKLKTNEQLDLYRSLLRPIKVKTAVVVLSVLLLSMIAMVSLVGYPLYQNYTDVKNNIALLEKSYNDLQMEQKKDALLSWNKAQEISQEDLGKIQKFMAGISENINLTRLDYKQGTLYVWAECQEESYITNLMGNLAADGWKDPLLIDYKYRKEITTFCLSVRR